MSKTTACSFRSGPIPGQCQRYVRSITRSRVEDVLKKAKIFCHENFRLGYLIFSQFFSRAILAAKIASWSKKLQKFS
jgi:hypothetical protein